VTAQPHTLRHACVESPWLQMAADDGAEWFRDHPSGDLAEYGAWCEAYELEQVLAGYGWRPGDPVTRQMQEALDAAYVGLQGAREVEVARRAARRATEAAAGRVGRPEWARSGAA
jgi:hypothetical protein